MKIGVLSTWYNEAPIAPYFLNHYRDWDEVRVLLETDTTDASEAILQQYSNVMIEHCHMERGLHELDKVAMLEEAFHHMKDCDWVAVVDSDEFLVPPNRGQNAKEFLQNKQNYECCLAYLHPVYRHKDDKDLNPELLPVPQRLHGTEPGRDEIKPCVLRSKEDIHLTIGCHSMERLLFTCPISFTGVHWANADPELAISRRLNRRLRFSQENLEKDWGAQHFNVTEESIRKECQKHENDPLIEKLIKLLAPVVEKVQGVMNATQRPLEFYSAYDVMNDRMLYLIKYKKFKFYFDSDQRCDDIGANLFQFSKAILEDENGKKGD